jgi:poly-gamma-glutamate capsule biosynthesis protein CapA/YwtB (metallophosphatase superfamily)
VERHNGGVIVYSLGNFIFGHGQKIWGDNQLARITFDDGKVGELELLPISGEGADVGQPSLLDGERAEKLLEEIRVRSGSLGTGVEIDGSIGRVSAASSS